VIHGAGWRAYNIWEHSASVRELYARRCRREAEEMTCHAQAAALLAPHARPGETLLDAGCGSGYFFHSLTARGIPVDYIGIDATECLIDIGRRFLPPFGLPAERLQTLRIEDADGDVDHVVCINVLSNIDNYHRPLERLLRIARRSIILRESCHDTPSYLYVRDRFLDDGVDLKVHVNTYQTSELVEFMSSYGFDVSVVPDERTAGSPEMVIGYPHYWTFLVGVRRSGGVA
jgi:cyclopropane fatty-acyl-phospholipid synthase-like methyltransferase